MNCFRDSLSDNLVENDLLVDRIENGNFNINDGVENFGTVLYNRANQVFGKNVKVKSGQSSSMMLMNQICLFSKRMYSSVAFI